LEVCVEGARLDEHLYAGPFEEVLKAYEAQVGWPRVPPLSEFELIKWRDVVSGPEDVLEDVHRFQAAGIPLGWVLLDNPWESCVGDLRFDRNRIPDPAGLVRKVHDLGVRFMLWVSPKVICGRGYQPSDLVGSRENRAVDLRRPDVVREFQTRLRKVFAIGVDGVKGDRADDVDLEPVSPTLHNEYPLLFARAVLDVLPPTAGGIFRAGTTGSQSVLPGLWAGDQRLSRLGLGHRRLLVERPHPGALRPLGPARSRLAGVRGRRDRAERDPLGARSGRDAGVARSSQSPLRARPVLLRPATAP
jgi:alpha-D-xyloside xylohydrolase